MFQPHHFQSSSAVPDIDTNTYIKLTVLQEDSVECKANTVVKYTQLNNTSQQKRETIPSNLIA